MSLYLLFNLAAGPGSALPPPLRRAQNNSCARPHSAEPVVRFRSCTRPLPIPRRILIREWDISLSNWHAYTRTFSIARS